MKMQRKGERDRILVGTIGLCVCACVCVCPTLQIWVTLGYQVKITLLF